MITLFDIWIFLGILLAMGISKMPKQYAMAVSLYASMAIMGVNKVIGSGDYLYWAIIGIESLCALLLIDFIRQLDRHSDRFFFRLMAGMFCVAVLVHLACLTHIVPFAVYTHLWQAVAILHLAIMIWYADGPRSLIGSWDLFGDSRTSRLSDH